MSKRIETQHTMASTSPAPARRSGRRHPLAAAALLLVGLLATGGAYALATTSATAETTVANEELIDEGFVAPLPTGLKRYWTPLRLTPIGDGVLEWMRRRTILPAEREVKLSDPLAIIH